MEGKHNFWPDWVDDHDSTIASEYCGELNCGRLKSHSIHSVEPAETLPICGCGAAYDSERCNKCGWSLTNTREPKTAEITEQEPQEVRYAGMSWSRMREHLIKAESERDAFKTQLRELHAIDWPAQQDIQESVLQRLNVHQIVRKLEEERDALRDRLAKIRPLLEII